MEHVAIEVRVETHKRLVDRLEGSLKRELSRQQIDDIEMMLAGLELVEERHIKPYVGK